MDYIQDQLSYYIVQHLYNTVMMVQVLSNILEPCKNICSHLTELKLTGFLFNSFIYNTTQMRMNSVFKYNKHATLLTG